jgi:hypothetical protein
MRAFSVGFLVHGWELRRFEDEETGEPYKARVFTDVELIEISAVAVPANREAVAKRFGDGEKDIAGDDDETLNVRALDEMADAEGSDGGGELSTRRIKKEAVRALRPVVRQEIRRALNIENDTSELQRVIDITAEVTARQCFEQITRLIDGQNSRAGGAPPDFNPERDAGEDFDPLSDGLDQSDEAGLDEPEDEWEGDDPDAGKKALERIRSEA